MEFERGQALKCIEGWAKAQTFPREKFQLVIAAPQSLDARILDELRGYLKPWDRLECYPCHHDIALAAEGARVADGAWLFFTESHCLPEPQALTKLMATAATHPDWEGFSNATTPLTHNFLSQIEAEMYDVDIRQTLSQSEWQKVLDQCFMIRRDAYFKCGGFEPEYGHFAEWLLSAGLHRVGCRLGVDLTAVLQHYYIGDFKELEEFTLDFARGHIKFVAEHADDARTAYFPVIPELEDCSAHALSDVGKMTRLRCAAYPVLTCRFLNKLLKRSFNPRKQRAYAAVWWNLTSDLMRCVLQWALGRRGAYGYACAAEWSAQRRLRWAIRREDRLAARSAHVEWFARLVHKARLNYLMGCASALPPTRSPEFLSSGTWTPQSGCGVELWGFFAGEGSRERPFRWSAHCAGAYVPLPQGRFRIELAWEPTRTLAQRDVLRVEFDGRRIPAKHLSLSANCLTFEVTSTTQGWHSFAWTVVPYHAPIDRRLLGLPMNKIQWAVVSR